MSELHTTVGPSAPQRGPTPQRATVPFRDRAQEAAAAWLAAHSITALRISLGLVFLGFGVLKFVPGASPAEELVMRTIDALTLGIVSGQAGVVVTAVLETFIGITLITGVALRLGLVVLAGSLVGIMSPLVLFTGDLFSGFTPTLEAQYVLKDIILATAAAVVGAKALGARYVVTERPGA